MTGISHAAPLFWPGKSAYIRPCSDSEGMPLSIAQPWGGFQKERAWLRFVRGNFPTLFPALVDQSQFHRRARSLCWLLTQMRYEIVKQMGVFEEEYRLIDGTPVHVRHWRRFGKTHLMLASAEWGYGAAKKETYSGYRLVVLTTLDGVLTDWELCPTAADEREAALDMFYAYKNLKALGDKGFLDQRRQALLQEDRHVPLLTPKRKNQKEQNAASGDHRMQRVRRLIETAFSQGKDGFGLESPSLARFGGSSAASSPNGLG